MAAVFYELTQDVPARYEVQDRDARNLRYRLFRHIRPSWSGAVTVGNTLTPAQAAAVVRVGGQVLMPDRQTVFSQTVGLTWAQAGQLTWDDLALFTWDDLDG